MTRSLMLTHALLWAAAILAASLLHAPTFLWLLVLPCLATMALLADHAAVVSTAKRSRAC